MDPLKVWLTNVDGDKEIALTGKALTNDDIVEFIRNLQQSGYFAGVLLEESRQTAEEGLIIYRSEEHTSELQSPCNLVCRLLLEKKKKKHIMNSLSTILLVIRVRAKKSAAHCTDQMPTRYARRTTHVERHNCIGTLLSHVDTTNI